MTPLSDYEKGWKFYLCYQDLAAIFYRKKHMILKMYLCHRYGTETSLCTGVQGGGTHGI